MGLYLAAGLNDLLILIVHNYNARSPLHPRQGTILRSRLLSTREGEGAHLQLPGGEVSGDLDQLAGGGLHLPSHREHHLIQLKRSKVRLRGRIPEPNSVWWKREKVELWGFVPDIANVLGGREGGESGSLAIWGLILEPGQGRNVSGGRVPVLPHQRNERGRVTSLTKEGMVEQLHCTCPLGGISHQHLVKEALQLWRHLLILQFWGRHVTNSSHRLKRRLIEEWRLAVYHLNHHDAQ